MRFRERMLRSSERKDSRVVLALDFSDPYDVRLKRAEKVLAATKGEVAAIKVNHHLLLPFGLKGIRSLIDVSRQEQLPLIADLKLNDIESTNLNVVDSLLAFGFDAVIANPFVGHEQGLARAIDRMHARDGGVILLVYMSHKGAGEGYGLKDNSGVPLYKTFAARAKGWGADGVVVSAKTVDKIKETRRIVGSECLIFSPGIGPQGGDASSGAGKGADFVIVGRSVTESSEPLEALRALKGSFRGK